MHDIFFIGGMTKQVCTLENEFGANHGAKQTLCWSCVGFVLDAHSQFLKSPSTEHILLIVKLMKNILKNNHQPNTRQQVIRWKREIYLFDFFSVNEGGHVLQLNATQAYPKISC